VCREVINLSEVGDGLFKLAFTKRGGRLGLKDKEGKPIREFNIEHGKDGITWHKSQGAKASANKAKAKNIKAESMVRDLIVKKGTITDPELRAWAQKTEGVGINAAISFAKAFAEDKVSGIYTYQAAQQVDANGKKVPGRRPFVFSTVMPDWMKEAQEQAEAKERAQALEELESARVREDENDPELQRMSEAKKKENERFEKEVLARLPATKEELLNNKRLHFKSEALIRIIEGAVKNGRAVCENGVYRKAEAGFNLGL
jgi:hypothetical protein